MGFGLGLGLGSWRHACVKFRHQQQPLPALAALAALAAVHVRDAIGKEEAVAHLASGQGLGLRVSGQGQGQG